MRRFRIATVLLFFIPLCAAFSAGEGAEGDWSVYASKRENLDTREFAVLPMRRDTATGHMETTAPGLPRAAIWRDENSEAQNIWNFRVRAESDKAAKAGKGDLILGWKAPTAGTWRLALSVRNDGLNVKGGDGGRLTVARLPQNEHSDNAHVFVLQIPSSKLQPPKEARAEELVRLQAGDRVHLRFSAKIDGYGDQFLGTFSAVPAPGAGREIPLAKPAVPEASLPQPPSARTAGAAPLRDGLFFLGVNGRWACSPFAEETIRKIHAVIPDLGLVMMTGNPEKFNRPDFYNTLGIPTIVQSIGRGWESFFKAESAYEIDWAGRDLSKKIPGVTLSGDAHAISLPHPATRRAFGQLSQTAIRMGHSGHGFPDMVWMWGAGRGRTGHNPATIAAFRRDLLGEDEGFVVSINSDPPKTMKLRDYAEFYIGSLPPPSAFGFNTWSDYEPPRKPASGNPPFYQPDYLLFDLLAHYEWLKLADFLGQTAEKEGGFFQCMPNPEDVANGCDFYFLNALPSVRATSEEFFKSVSWLDGAYYRYPSLTRERSGNRQHGLVLESGQGGNQWPYYDHETAWLAAYELTLATEAGHLEGDFWPGLQQPLAGILKNEAWRERARQLMAFGIGFSHAREDGAKRPAPDFVSISSRRVFRPWGAKWQPWQNDLGTFPTPDLTLAQAGYVFAGMGEDVLSLSESDGAAGLVDGKPVLYSPSTATEKGWDALLSKLRNGKIPLAIVAAPGVGKMITKDFRLSDPPPEMAGADRDEVVREFGFSEDKKPLVTRRTVGRGILYKVLFDPSKPENTEITARIYGALLKKARIAPRWETPPGTFARVYYSGEDKNGLVVGVQSATVRDWQKQTEGRPSLTGRIANKMPGARVSVRIKMRPDAELLSVALPSGERREVASDQDGWLELTANDVTWQVFHVFPADKTADAKAARLAGRSQVLQDALQQFSSP
ncbi:hypothetical protein OpiT1DRAFT_05148 [Opitutaceae bacterium TAV1]|nr:hypothetical protein OpiT1DRAFT_05148 [Opitutaceae bacterium TAV1]